MMIAAMQKTEHDCIACSLLTQLAEKEIPASPFGPRGIGDVAGSV
jgi:hypothetical protein